MTFYRICDRRFNRPATAFSGECAARVSHRWNHAATGLRAVYASDSLALACLERLVHIRPLPRLLPGSIYYSITIPDDLLEQPAARALPTDSAAPVPRRAARDFGTAFLRSRRAVGLVVPTAIQPLGRNVLINTLHTEFDLRWVKGPWPYPFDRRLE